MPKPTTRILTLLELLQTHERLTGSELAQRLEVDIRTVRRYISALEELGIPVTTEQGRYGGYMLVAGFKLPPMMFTDEETQAIALGLLAARQLGVTEISPALASVQAKLERVMPDRLKHRVRAVSDSIHIVLAPTEPPKTSGALLLLTDAAQSQRRVIFSYQSRQDEVTRRECDPYGLVYRRGRWYLCGYCHLRHALRTFRLDRLQEVKVLDTSFVRPVDFDAVDYLQHSLITAQRQHSVSILLHTSIDAAGQALGSIEALCQQQDDGLLLRTTTDSYTRLARWLAALPFDFKVVAPDELKNGLREQAGRLMAAAEG
jgi:predicted DNA-binding transcriptional regulator YafY